MSLTSQTDAYVEKPIPSPIVPESAPAPHAQKITAVPVAAAPNIPESQLVKKPESPDASEDDILFKHLEMLRDLKTNRQENT